MKSLIVNTNVAELHNLRTNREQKFDAEWKNSNCENCRLPKIKMNILLKSYIDQVFYHIHNISQKKNVRKTDIVGTWVSPNTLPQ